MADAPSNSAAGKPLLFLTTGTVEKALFSITCTTCRRRLAVRSAEVVGAILDCPKCGSFVQVVPPEDWVPPGKTRADADEAVQDKGPKPTPQRPAGSAQEGARPTPTPPSPTTKKSISPEKAAPVVLPAVPSQVAATSALAAAFCPPPEVAGPVAPPVVVKAAAQPVLAPGSSGRMKPVAAASAAAAVPAMASAGITSSQPIAPAALSASGATVGEAGPAAWLAVPPFWARWLMLAVAPMVGMGIVVGIWAVFLAPNRQVPTPASVAQKSDEPPETEPSPKPEEKTHPKAAPARFDRRWLPDGTRLVVSLRASRLAKQPQTDKLLGPMDALWRKSAGAILRSFELSMDKVQRLTWASTDLANWPERCVAVIELEEGQSAGTLATKGQAVDVGAANLAYRRLSGEAYPNVPGNGERGAATHWPHPFAMLDERTIVTGHEELLRGLAQRGEFRPESAPLDRLLKAVVPEGDVTVLVDLVAARKAGWGLPAGWLDVWPAGKKPWRHLWEVPEGVACALYGSGMLRSELALVCEGESTAEKVRAALDEFLPAAKKALGDNVKSLQEKLDKREVPADAADRYKLLLDQGLAAIQAARWDAADGTVWVRMNWGQNPLTAADAAVDSYSLMRDDWLSAGLEADKKTHARLIKGLHAHLKTDGAFPAGASGSALVAPDTRLSWIAATLPYLDHADWHQKLKFPFAWNGPQNREVARLALPEVINPVLGPNATEAGFPVTQYVGVSGLGEDAGTLPANDPRAGVFGNARPTRVEDIADGASCTIAMMGVSARNGAWAQGGSSTVRPLTQRPYVNGPDGFGSGQPNGMLVTMADGAVRFLSDKTDPRVIEQMVTIRGGERLDMASLDRQSPPVPAAGPVPEKIEPKLAAKPESPAPKEKPAPRPKPRPVREENDLDARFAHVIPKIDLPEMPLLDAVTLLAALANVRVAFDTDAMQELGVTLHDPVAVNLAGVTIAKALDTVAADQRLTCAVEHGQLLITSPPAHRELLRPARYRVEDLVADDAQALSGIAALVQQLIVPDSWQSNGGRGTIEAKDGSLAVLQTGNVHAQIIAFCEKLRVARGKPLRSRLNPELFAMTTRTARAKPVLDRPVTANYQNARLVEVLDFLKKSSGCEVLIDWPDLAAEGIKDDVKATLQVAKKPLSAALGELLAPLKLNYRVVDAKVLEVSTAKTVASRLELEFYPAAALLAKEQPAALVARLRGRLAGASWSDSGGAGVLLVEAPSQCLLVLQSQPVQAALEAALAEKGK
jgi:hypothetical protein